MKTRRVTEGATRACLVFFVVALVSVDSSLGSLLPTQESALMQLYQAWGPIATGWGPDGSTGCSWGGVTCALKINYEVVTILDLPVYQINGSIPGAIGLFNDLVTLKLHGNSLQGPIPPEMANLTSLVTLDLSVNQLKSTIPSFLASLPNLTTIDLHQNQLSGPIPADLFASPQIQNLVLYKNELTELPAHPFQSTDFQTLDVSSNLLSGTIPNWMFSSPNAPVFIYLYDNDLTGTLPIVNSSKVPSISFFVQNNSLSLCPNNYINPFITGRIFPQKRMDFDSCACTMNYPDWSYPSFRCNLTDSYKYAIPARTFSTPENVPLVIDFDVIDDTTRSSMVTLTSTLFDSRGSEPDNIGLLYPFSDDCLQSLTVDYNNTRGICGATFVPGDVIGTGRAVKLIFRPPPNTASLSWISTLATSYGAFKYRVEQKPNGSGDASPALKAFDAWIGPILVVPENRAPTVFIDQQLALDTYPTWAASSDWDPYYRNQATPTICSDECTYATNTGTIRLGFHGADSDDVNLDVYLASVNCPAPLRLSSTGEIVSAGQHIGGLSVGSVAPLLSLDLNESQQVPMECHVTYRVFDGQYMSNDTGIITVRTSTTAVALLVDHFQLFTNPELTGTITPAVEVLFFNQRWHNLTIISNCNPETADYPTELDYVRIGCDVLSGTRQIPAADNSTDVIPVGGNTRSHSIRTSSAMQSPYFRAYVQFFNNIGQGSDIYYFAQGNDHLNQAPYLHFYNHIAAVPLMRKDYTGAPLELVQMDITQTQLVERQLSGHFGWAGFDDDSEDLNVTLTVELRCSNTDANNISEVCTRFGLDFISDNTHLLKPIIPGKNWRARGSVSTLEQILSSVAMKGAVADVRSPGSFDVIVIFSDEGWAGGCSGPIILARNAPAPCVRIARSQLRVNYLGEDTSGCVGPRPAPQFECLGNTWVATGDVSVPGGISITPSSTPVQIVGNLTVGGDVTFTGLGGSVNVIDGCITIAGGVVVQLSEEDIRKIQNEHGGRFQTTLLTHSGAACTNSLADVGVKVVPAKSTCRKTKTSTATSTPSSLNTLFEIDSSKCNVKWIVLGTILGVVVVAGAIGAIGYGVISRKQKAGRKQLQAAANK